MEVADASDAQRRANLIWLAALSGICGLIFLYEMRISIVPTPDALLYRFFIYFEFYPIATLVLGLVFHQLVGRLKPQKTWIAVVAIYLALVASNEWIAASARENWNTAANSLQKSAADAQMLLNNSGKTLPFDTRPQSTGAIGEYERFQKIMLNKGLALQNGYLSELDAIAYGDLLSPNRLAKDRDLRDSKTMVAEAKKIVAKYAAQNVVVLNEGVNEIQSLSLGDLDKARMLNAYERQIEEARQLIAAKWERERKTVEEAAAMIALLDANKRRWAIKDDQIEFTNDRLMQEYNKHLDAIDGYAAEQEKSDAAITKNLNDDLEKMKKH